MTLTLDEKRETLGISLTSGLCSGLIVMFLTIVLREFEKIDNTSWAYIFLIAGVIGAIILLIFSLFILDREIFKRHYKSLADKYPLYAQ